MRFLLGTSIAGPELRIGLTIGFCDSFTTMSTFGYETLAMLQAGRSCPLGTEEGKRCHTGFAANGP